MGDYRTGYDYYKQVCEQHELEPLNFHYFILNLSQKQLDAYNECAHQKRGIDEYSC